MFTSDTIRVSTSALADSPDLMNRTTVRQRLRTMLATGALTADELAEATGESEATIRKTLARMVKAEEAVQLPGPPLRWGRRA
jgi:response regulator of citrate/malate metabolism